MSRYLTRRGYRVTTADDAKDARVRLKSLSFDLIVLDVMMPGENGFEFAAARCDRESQVPILMLTAHSESADRVRGFEVGADDYLVKPFEPRELSLRIASILRRSAPAQRGASRMAVRFGNFIFHVERGELREGEEVVRLTERERIMLKLLVESAGEPVCREALAGDIGAGNERTIDVQVNRLRRKIERDPANPAILQTVRGSGYG